MKMKATEITETGLYRVTGRFQSLESGRMNRIIEIERVNGNLGVMLRREIGFVTLDRIRDDLDFELEQCVYEVDK